MATPTPARTAAKATAPRIGTGQSFRVRMVRTSRESRIRIGLRIGFTGRPVFAGHFSESPASILGRPARRGLGARRSSSSLARSRSARSRRACASRLIGGGRGDALGDRATRGQQVGPPAGIAPGGVGRLEDEHLPLLLRGEQDLQRPLDPGRVLAFGPDLLRFGPELLACSATSWQSRPGPAPASPTGHRPPPSSTRPAMRTPPGRRSAGVPGVPRRRRPRPPRPHAPPPGPAPRPRRDRP